MIGTTNGRVEDNMEDVNLRMRVISSSVLELVSKFSLLELDLILLIK